MKHQISISTVDALVINKALRMDLQNEVDNEIAKQIIDRINLAVEKDLKKRKQPTEKVVTDFLEYAAEKDWVLCDAGDRAISKEEQKNLIQEFIGE